MLPCTVMRIFTNINQFIIILSVSAPVKVLIQFCIGDLGSRIILSSKCSQKSESTRGCFCITRLYFIYAVSSHIT